MRWRSFATSASKAGVRACARPPFRPQPSTTPFRTGSKSARHIAEPARIQARAASRRDEAAVDDETEDRPGFGQRGGARLGPHRRHRARWRKQASRSTSSAARSIGALVGAAYVAGRLPALEEWALGLKWHDIVGMLDVRLIGGGLINGRLIAGALKRLGLDGTIEDLSEALRRGSHRPRHRAGRSGWRRVRSSDAVRASMCASGRLSAGADRRRAGWWTAGLVNPVPVSTCRALGADIIIAVNLNGDLVGRRGISTEKRTRLMQPETVNRLISRLPNDMRDRCPASPGAFCNPARRRPVISTCSPIRSTSCRTRSPAAASPASRRIIWCCRTRRVRPDGVQPRAGGDRGRPRGRAPFAAGVAQGPGDGSLKATDARRKKRPARTPALIAPDKLDAPGGPVRRKDPGGLGG